MTNLTTFLVNLITIRMEKYPIKISIKQLAVKSIQEKHYILDKINLT